MGNLNALKKSVYDANMALHGSGLVLYTFGNVSGIDRTSGMVVIKPSGVDYQSLSADDMVVVSLENGDVVEGNLSPSSDTPTHLELYRNFAGCGGIAHTHSETATACAQARTPIRCMGTTQADYFRGDIPLTRMLTEQEVSSEYEANTGRVIVATFAEQDPMEVPAVLVANHGPFAWGASPAEAVRNAVLVESLARMELAARTLNPEAPRPPAYLVDKHYLRKHGDNAYYGQKDSA